MLGPIDRTQQHGIIVHDTWCKVAGSRSVNRRLPGILSLVYIQLLVLFSSRRYDVSFVRHFLDHGLISRQMSYCGNIIIKIAIIVGKCTRHDSVSRCLFPTSATRRADSSTHTRPSRHPTYIAAQAPISPSPLPASPPYPLARGPSTPTRPPIQPWPSSAREMLGGAHRTAPS